MKIINCNSWAPYDIKWAPDVPIPNTNPLIANYIILYDNFYVYDNDGGLAIFYHRLKDELYNILDEDDYFDEDN